MAVIRVNGGVKQELTYKKKTSMFRSSVKQNSKARREQRLGRHEGVKTDVDEGMLARVHPLLKKDEF